MLFKNLFISSLIISFLFLSINSLPILATNSTQRPSLKNQNSIQNKAQNLKTQIEITKIEFQKANNLANSWEKIQKVIQSDETSLTFDSQIRLSKISFNLPIPITKNDNLQNIVDKSSQIKNSILDSLIKQKNEEQEFLDKQVFDTTDKNMANLQEQMTILANLDILEMQNLKTQNYNSDNLFANSLTITTNNQSQNAKNIEKIANENSLTIDQIDLTNANKNDKRDQNLKPKIKLKSNKIAKKTKKLGQIQSENSKLSELSSTPSVEIQSSFSSSSLVVLPEINLSNSISSSSSSEMSATPITPKTRDLLEITESSNENRNNSNNSTQNEVLITQNLIQENVQENVQENNFENSEVAKKLDKNPQKITKITKFRYKNPFFISQKEQEQRNQEIETEKQKALTHNRKFKQYYSQSDYQKMIDSNTVPDSKIYPYGIINEKGKEIEPKNLPKLKDKTGWLDSILSLGSVETTARGLNNSVSSLLIYSWTNPNLTLDLPNGNLNNGTQLGLYGRHGGWNQTFMFDNNSNQIRMNGKCLEVSAGNFNNGTRIQIWDCHGGSNQKWVFVSNSLRPMYNQNFCLEQNAGITEGTRINLWSCNGNNNQVWVAGNNDFQNYFSVNIHASNVNIISTTPNIGHVFLAYKTNSQLVNTQSSWPGSDTDCSTNNGNINNICDNDAAYVDKIEDWNYSRYNDPGFRIKTVYISKQISDVYRYNSGYRWQPQNNGCSILNNYNYTGLSFNSCNGNCASFSTRVWNNIMGDSNYSSSYIPMTYLPTDVWLSI